MDIIELGAIGELVGGVAVLATLAYLAAQVRQVRKLSRTAAADQTWESWRDVCALVKENAALYRNGSVDFAGLSDSQKFAFVYVMNPVFAYLENFQIKHREGVIDEDEWERQNRVLMWYLAWPGMPSWWERVEAMFTKPFAAHVRQILRGFENGTIERPDLYGYADGDPWGALPGSDGA